MGQKVNPIGFRVGINKAWDSTWFASKQDFAKFLKEDSVIRNYFSSKHAGAGIAKVEIERTENRVVINLYTARPAILIGPKGANIEQTKKELAKFVQTKSLIINVKEVKRPDLDAQLVADSIVAQLEKRVAYKRALKQALARVMKAGAKGCKVRVSGVVNGANTMASDETYLEGNLPLQTIRADIDYATAAAYTNYGKLGVKVWIYKGDILASKSVEDKGGNE